MICGDGSANCEPKLRKSADCCQNFFHDIFVIFRHDSTKRSAGVSIHQIANRSVRKVPPDQLRLVILSEVEKGASGTSDMNGCSARAAARESGNERVNLSMFPRMNRLYFGDNLKWLSDSPYRLLDRIRTAAILLQRGQGVNGSLWGPR